MSWRPSTSTAVEHLRHRRTEDIGVQESHFIAETSQGNGKVCRYGALAHSTLAATYGNDILHLGQEFLYLWARLRLVFERDVYLHLVAGAFALHLAHVVADCSLGRLDGRLEERVGVARKNQ